MGRIRTIKPPFFQNEEVASCHPLARICFVGMWCMADKAGRLEDRPKRIKVETLPHDDCDVEVLLSELVSANLINRYEVGGRKYIQINTFTKHQRPHPKEPVSEIPEPCFSVKKNGRAVKRFVPAVEKSSVLQEGKGREGVSGREQVNSCSEVATPPSEPNVPLDEKVVLVFPVIAEKGKPQQWSLLESKLAEYAESFPGIDASAECRKARQWCIDNPKKRKTYGGMTKFLSGWLGRAQDRGTTHGPSPPHKKPERFSGIKEWLEETNAVQ